MAHEGKKEKKEYNKNIKTYFTIFLNHKRSNHIHGESV